MFSINQGTNEDDSQSNPHPEAGLLTSGREDRHDMATGVQRERLSLVRTWSGHIRSVFFNCQNWYGLKRAVRSLFHQRFCLINRKPAKHSKVVNYHQKIEQNS